MLLRGSFIVFKCIVHFAAQGVILRIRDDEDQRIQGGFENETGQTEKVVGMTPKLHFDPASKRLQHGEFLFQMEDGSERLLAFKKLSETGFYLGSGHYHGGDGHHPGL